MMEQLELFALGVAALQSFVAVNWAGDEQDKAGLDEEVQIPISDVESRLVLDGESLCPVARRLHLLLLARSLLCDNEATIYTKNWVSCKSKDPFRLCDSTM